jgi:hypothetical protein
MELDQRFSEIGAAWMTGSGPSPWSTSVTKGAVSLLVAVVAIDIAVHLIVAVLPVLIPIAIGLAVVYSAWLFHRRNSSKW